MKTLGAVLIRVVLYLIILVVGTYVMLIILEAAALAIPSVQTYLSCPEGTTINLVWVHESQDDSGVKTLERHCVNKDGEDRDVAFSNDIYNQRQNDLFMPIAFVVMLIIEIPLVIVHYIRKNRRGQQNPG